MGRTKSGWSFYAPLTCCLIATWVAGAQRVTLPSAPKPELTNPGIQASQDGVEPSSSGPTLTLQDAEATAVRNEPLIIAAQLRARAAAARTSAQRSGYLPTINFNSTGVLVADPDTATAAGALTTSSISDRFAYGGTLVQLVTDFGRTSALVGSAREAAEAEGDRALFTRAQVRLNVREAYFQVLGEEAVLRAAREAQANRRLIQKQVTALAQSQLRSTLDVNFAGVLESQAELAVVRAEAAVEQQRARLATAMGRVQPVTAPLAEVALPATLPSDLKALLAQASQDRADLNAARADQSSAEKFATAERRLSYPTLNLLGAAGEIPYHDHTLQDSYAAAGFNLNIPVFNGGLFAAERQEAALNANARAHDVAQTALQINEEVRDSWYAAQEAFRSVAVTQRLVVQAKEALRLAQARYNAGLGSIVELNEAQLNETSAEISAADATYTYLTRRAQLDYAVGLLN